MRHGIFDKKIIVVEVSRFLFEHLKVYIWKYFRRHFGPKEEMPLTHKKRSLPRLNTNATNSKIAKPNCDIYLTPNVTSIDGVWNDSVVKQKVEVQFGQRAFHM